MFFDHNLLIVTLYALILHKFPFINTHKSFRISHSTISHSLILLCSTMCFHRLPFIRKGYSNILEIVWMIKDDGATLQIGTIFLGVRLICLDVRLTIKVSFALERKQTIPHHPFPSIFLSFSPHRFNIRCLTILCYKLQFYCKCTISIYILIKW